MVVVIVLLQLIAQVYSKEKVVGCTDKADQHQPVSNVQASMDNLVGKVIQSLVCQTFEVHPRYLAGTENVTRGKRMHADVNKCRDYKQTASFSPSGLSSNGPIRNGWQKHHKIGKLSCRPGEGVVQSLSWKKKALLLSIVALNIACPIIGSAGWGIAALFSCLHISSLVTVGAAIGGAGTVIGPAVHSITVPWLTWIVAGDSAIRTFLTEKVLAVLPSRLRSKLTLAVENTHGEKNQVECTPMNCVRSRTPLHLRGMRHQHHAQLGYTCKNYLGRVSDSRTFKQGSEHIRASISFFRKGAFKRGAKRLMYSRLMSGMVAAKPHRLLGPQGQQTGAATRKRKRADDTSLASKKRKAARLWSRCDRASVQSCSKRLFPAEIVPRVVQVGKPSPAARLASFLERMRAHRRAIRSARFPSSL